MNIANVMRLFTDLQISQHMFPLHVQIMRHYTIQHSNICPHLIAMIQSKYYSFRHLDISQIYPMNCYESHHWSSYFLSFGSHCALCNICILHLNLDFGLLGIEKSSFFGMVTTPNSTLRKHVCKPTVFKQMYLFILCHGFRSVYSNTQQSKGYQFRGY